VIESAPVTEFPVCVVVEDEVSVSLCEKVPRESAPCAEIDTLPADESERVYVPEASLPLWAIVAEEFVDRSDARLSQLSAHHPSNSTWQSARGIFAPSEDAKNCSFITAHLRPFSPQKPKILFRQPCRSPLNDTASKVVLSGRTRRAFSSNIPPDCGIGVAGDDERTSRIKPENFRDFDASR